MSMETDWRAPTNTAPHAPSSITFQVVISSSLPLFSCVCGASPSTDPSMAVPVARVHLAMAHAAMPGLLPTPPQCKMLPLLPTPSCAAAAVILPDQSPPNKPGRADAVDRWDAYKTTLIKSAADAAERKITAKSSSGQLLSSPKSSIASSCERWDINKKSPTSFSSSTSSSPTSRGSSWSSDERWDAHKKQAHGNDDDSEDDVQTSTGSNDMEMEAVDDEPQQKQMELYAGPGLLAVAPPETSLLPIPAFLVLPRFVAA
jgi:hypothetical protein